MRSRPWPRAGSDDAGPRPSWPSPWHSSPRRSGPRSAPLPSVTSQAPMRLRQAGTRAPSLGADRCVRRDPNVPPSQVLLSSGDSEHDQDHGGDPPEASGTAVLDGVVPAEGSPRRVIVPVVGPEAAGDEVETAKEEDDVRRVGSPLAPCNGSTARRQPPWAGGMADKIAAPRLPGIFTHGGHASTRNSSRCTGCPFTTSAPPRTRVPASRTSNPSPTDGPTTASATAAAVRSTIRPSAPSSG